MQSAKSKVCSLTMWKQDWTAEEWANAIQHTAVFLKEVFASEKLEHAVDSTWGRSLRNGRQPATHRDATSVQVHAAIREDSFLPFLKATGYNKIWAAPKGEDGRIIDEYRVLWLPANYDHQRASTVTAKLRWCCRFGKGTIIHGSEDLHWIFWRCMEGALPTNPCTGRCIQQVGFQGWAITFWMQHRHASWMGKTHWMENEAPSGDWTEIMAFVFRRWAAHRPCIIQRASSAA